MGYSTRILFIKMYHGLVNSLPWKLYSLWSTSQKMWLALYFPLNRNASKSNYSHVIAIIWFLLCGSWRESRYMDLGSKFVKEMYHILLTHILETIWHHILETIWYHTLQIRKRNAPYSTYIGVYIYFNNSRAQYPNIKRILFLNFEDTCIYMLYITRCTQWRLVRSSHITRILLHALQTWIEQFLNRYLKESKTGL